jgi:hypothetical protein
VEPDILRRGKEFHRRVQSDWEKTAEGKIHCEHGIVRALKDRNARHVRRGRLDLFVDEIGDFAAVVEIKSTNWEQVMPNNVQKLLSSHQRQVWRYVDKYVDNDLLNIALE